MTFSVATAMVPVATATATVPEDTAMATEGKGLGKAIGEGGSS